MPKRSSRSSLIHSLGVLSSYTLLFLIFFSPVLFSSQVLAPGDGIIYFLPNFASSHTLWEPTIWGGFPSVGDSQLMLWYPPAILFSIAGTAGYQPFLLFAYVLASSFTYGFVYSLTSSRLSSAVSGTIYGLCGFMISHVGHASVIHSAAWLPLMAWSISSLKHDTKGKFWFCIGTIAVACCFLAGHPQVFVYSACLVFVFAVFNCFDLSGIERAKYLCEVVAIFVLGCGLAAVQIWPTAELTSLSWRAALNFPEFVAYELPLRQLPGLIFPYLYGGSPSSFYGLPYFGAWPSSADGWGSGELTGYAGLFTLLLAGGAATAYRRNFNIPFWMVVALVALLLTLGDATPLATAFYHLPVLNKFRVPARHFIELTFALSVLAGYGVSAFQRSVLSDTAIKKLIVGSAITLVLCLLSLQLFAGKINELAVQRLGHTVGLRPWSNAALLVPLMLFVVECFVLYYWTRRPESQKLSALLVTFVILDLASFAQFAEWHYRSPYKSYANIPARAEQLRSDLDNTHQRILPVRGGTGYVNELPPNLSKLWKLPSASGYGPFILTRVSNLLTMPPHGSVDESWRDSSNQALNLMAVKYVILPPDSVAAPSTADQKGTHWSNVDLNAEIGSGCNPANSSNYELKLEQPVEANAILIVGALACSVEIGDNSQIATLIVTAANGKSNSYPVLAGRDFSEWAHDCQDVSPVIKHQRAEVFRSYPSHRGQLDCEAHDYVARFQFDEPVDIKSVSVSWTGKSGTFVLKKLTATENGNSIPLNSSTGSLGNNSHWRLIGRVDASNSGYGSNVSSTEQGTGIVYENLEARPRVWLVPEVLQLSQAEIFNSVRSSRLPDGRQFNPALTALVEKSVELHQQPENSATATVSNLSANSMEVHTTAIASSFLVTSDVFYPGWHATIDGMPVEIIQTDYTLRGVSVPAGSHVVRFYFKPRTLYLGLIVSLISALLVVGRFVFHRFRRGGTPWPPLVV